MHITIEIKPDDVANIITDLKFKKCFSKNLLDSILKIVKKEYEIQLEELDIIQTVLNESGSVYENYISQQIEELEEENKKDKDFIEKYER